MEKVLKIWEDYILDIYIGLYKGTLEHILHAVCMAGALKSVQLHNIGSMCVTVLPTQISLVVSAYLFQYDWNDDKRVYMYSPISVRLSFYSMSAM